MKPDQLELIRRHGEQLLVIFPLATEKDPVKLCKKLRRLEWQANDSAVKCCNGEIADEADDNIRGVIKSKLDKLLHYTEQGVPVFLNGDPRGYSLKIQDEYVRANNLAIHRDWGGYGILAPEIE